MIETVSLAEKNLTSLSNTSSFTKDKKTWKKELIQQGINASIHYGHFPQLWNPKMAPYLLYVKYGYHIFDLVLTSNLLDSAGNFLEKKAKKGGKFLFVGTTRFASPLVTKQAQRCGNFYINSRWLGGLLTNWPTIRKRIQKLKIFEKQEAEGYFKNFSKKEYSRLRKKMNKLRRLFTGIKEMTTLPDAVIFTNSLKEINAIQECLRSGIPAISIVDSNCNPDSIPYIIPANDDSPTSINFILNYLGNRILNGYNNKSQGKKKNKKFRK